MACPIPLTEEQRLGLVRLAADAWFTHQDEVRFDWPACVGVVRPGSDVVSLGTFVGQQFYAEVETPEQRGKVAFLVAEKLLAGVGEA